MYSSNFFGIKFNNLYIILNLNDKKEVTNLVDGRPRSVCVLVPTSARSRLQRPMHAFLDVPKIHPRGEYSMATLTVWKNSQSKMTVTTVKGCAVEYCSIFRSAVLRNCNPTSGVYVEMSQRACLYGLLHVHVCTFVRAGEGKFNVSGDNYECACVVFQITVQFDHTVRFDKL